MERLFDKKTAATYSPTQSPTQYHRLRPLNAASKHVPPWLDEGLPPGSQPRYLDDQLCACADDPKSVPAGGADLRPSLRPNQCYPRLATEFAYTLQRIGHHNEARRLALEAISSWEPSERATACKILATITFFEQKKEAALQWIMRGLEIAPDDPDLKLMLEAVEELR